MSATTRVAAAQDALKTLLQGASGLAGVRIDLGSPAGELGAEEIWLAGVEGWNETTAITGTSAAGSQRDETFTLKLEGVVTQSTNDYKTVRDRAITLIQVIEGVISTNPTLSGAVFQANLANKQLTDAWADTQRQAVFSLGVDCLAVLA